LELDDRPFSPTRGVGEKGSGLSGPPIADTRAHLAF